MQGGAACSSGWSHAPRNHMGSHETKEYTYTRRWVPQRHQNCADHERAIEPEQLSVAILVLLACSFVSEDRASGGQGFRRTGLPEDRASGGQGIWRTGYLEDRASGGQGCCARLESLAALMSISSGCPVVLLTRVNIVLSLVLEGRGYFELTRSGRTNRGDLVAIRRIAEEFVEDCSRQLVAYCEVRFSPHLLMPHSPAGSPGTALPVWVANDVSNGQTNGSGGGDVTVDSIVETVLAGIAEGEKRCPGTKVRVILCCIRGISEWSREVLELCDKYRNKGVVGIDIAGCHDSKADRSAYSEGSEVFQEAEKRGIRRTVHAGEDGPAASVLAAVDDLKAERIGHGYRVVEDEAVYKQCREKVHFEVCPSSSYLTGAIQSLDLTSKRHPVLRFAEDEVSFSINTDDPLLTCHGMQEEYDLLASWGCSEAIIVRANFQAALHSFLPPSEKQALLRQLRSAYGVPELDACLPQGSVSRASPAGDKPCITLNTWDNRT
ncbi:Adenosine/AMP deaminase domain [Trinorchestia longiramus]|nr:Adenosine/AMP deaminase domain [Trinorchestia longiramus]